MENRKILIVEDEESSAHYLESILKKRLEPVEIKKETCRQNAIEVTKRFLPDLLLMEISTGLETSSLAAIDEILQFHRPEVIYIAHPNNLGALSRNIITQPINYILKPFENTQIEIALRLALKRLPGAQ